MGAPAGWRGEGTVAVLCAPRGATGGVRGAMRAAGLAGRGFVWVTVVEDRGGGGGRVTQLLWNERVRRVVREGLGTGVRYVPGTKTGAGGRGVEREVVLMLDGRVWEPGSTEGGKGADKVGEVGTESIEGRG